MLRKINNSLVKKGSKTEIYKVGREYCIRNWKTGTMNYVPREYLELRFKKVLKTAGKRLQFWFVVGFCELRIKKLRSGEFIFVEAHLYSNPDHYSKGFKTYEDCVKGLQRYSRKYYGGKAV